MKKTLLLLFVLSIVKLQAQQVITFNDGKTKTVSELRFSKPLFKDPILRTGNEKINLKQVDSIHFNNYSYYTVQKKNGKMMLCRYISGDSIVLFDIPSDRGFDFSTIPAKPIGNLLTLVTDTTAAGITMFNRQHVRFERKVRPVLVTALLSDQQSAEWYKKSRFSKTISTISTIAGGGLIVTGGVLSFSASENKAGKTWACLGGGAALLVISEIVMNQSLKQLKKAVDIFNSKHPRKKSVVL